MHADRLDEEVAKLEGFFRESFDEGDAPEWSEVLFVETINDYKEQEFFRIRESVIKTSSANWFQSTCLVRASSQLIRTRRAGTDRSAQKWLAARNN